MSQGFPLPAPALAARRARPVSQGAPGPGPAVYWMHREHRFRHNWGLALAAGAASAHGRALVVAYCLCPAFLSAGPGHYRFLRQGLAETARLIEAAGARFCLCLGDPAQEIPRLMAALRPLAVFTDFDPLRLKRSWAAAVAKDLSAPLFEVDSRNVVPCRLASDKAEYMARTLRPKIHRLLPDFLDEPGPLPPLSDAGFPALPDGLCADHREIFARDEPQGVARPARPCAAPGEEAARLRLARFVEHGLAAYADARNDPAKDGQSGLSPYLHFGQLSAAEVARRVMDAGHAPEASRRAFIEELVVRRELSDNFCLHRPDYDAPSAFPDWARKTLAEHENDPRPALYTEDRLENAATDDPLWNAAQQEMLVTGRMHGYLRMYWCKKLLEWTPDAARAQALAIALNDRHQLDGRETNGYAGIAWSLGGVHDRPWPARPVFGTVRFMSLRGAASKFSIPDYIRRVEALTGTAVRGAASLAGLAKRPRL